MAGSRGARRWIRWVMRHGAVRREVTRQSDKGDLGARMIVHPDAVRDPYPAYEEIRAQGRMVRSALSWTTVDHEITTAVLRSPDFCVGMRMPENAPGLLKALMSAGGTWPLGPAEPPSLLSIDPPDHNRIRKLVTRSFSAKAIARLRTRTEEVAADLLDEMEARTGADRRADVIAEYASLLPATVIAEMLGAPVEMREQFLQWGEGGAYSLDMGLSYAMFRRSEKDIDALAEWMSGHFDHLRAHPNDSILSSLVHAYDSEEGRLTSDELLSLALLLLAAGFETTVNLIGNGTKLLLAHPDQRERLAADPSLWPNAVDEILRLDSPVQRTGRVAARDTEVCGFPVRRGALVLTHLGGANRDPEVFPEPDRFDVGRVGADKHVAFSQGIHYCLGAALAKMEGEVGLRALFDRYPDLRSAGPAELRGTRVLRGYRSLPVRLGDARVPVGT
ncbi:MULTISPECIES: cytochrome P450 [unclassified Pseudonocardia]|uniref:cytochrome P450 n=1 Tax=unclassified Pseudonocardia TaxID=2619320 RepID=UPI000492C668|nr:cytochrome P450 [Pseudonocardia sp. Ae707_Ps1]OLM19444.1 putative cytochrome P450 hydroxylase [Pseudonocardia sp. Ae707_Ps1]